MVGVIALILLGIFLFLVEFLILPGITVAGIGGIALLGGGIYLAFEKFGNETGFFVLVSSFLVSVAILAFSLRAKTWKRVMLHTNIEGHANEAPPIDSILPGDKGITMTRLGPIGKVKVNGIVVEGKSTGGYISPHTEIEVVRLTGYQAIVKPIK
jgi:membrane-bound ClpP family serine protease